MDGSGFNARYIAQRSDPDTGFGYGLHRRTLKLLDGVADHAPGNAGQLDVIDFGCAEGSMLRAVGQSLGDRYGTGLGLDVFRAGVPMDDGTRRITFHAANLFKCYPYPVPDASRDIAIVSAFIKHHPEPQRFLAEVARILRPGGIAVLLDPRPFVVRVGMLVGRFNPAYNPSLWSRRSMLSLITNHRLPLHAEAYDRYWVAPTGGLYRLGIEGWLPKWMAWPIAMHQSLVLRRLADV